MADKGTKNDPENKLRQGRSCAYLLHVQVIFASFPRNFNGEGDHVHLLVEHLPKVSLSKLPNSLKGVYSRLPEKNYPQMASYY